MIPWMQCPANKVGVVQGREGGKSCVQNRIRDVLEFALLRGIAAEKFANVIVPAIARGQANRRSTS